MRMARVLRLNAQGALLLALLVALVCVAPPRMLNAQSRTMDIYWIDAEGGGATLIVSPSGESLLVDTGYLRPDDRDAKRIFAATQQAGLKKIDYLMITHFHGDHVGGLSALAKMIPIERFIDHGGSIESENQKWHDLYMSLAAGKRIIAKAGEMIPLKGVEVRLISSNAELVLKAINDGGPNPLCANAERKPPATPENQRSLGALFTHGRFRFLDLGDLDWEKEMELSCPVNRLGTVTLYQTSRHGLFDGAGAPAHIWALKPQVVVVNNGPRKGLGEPHMYERIARIPGIEGIWQTHLALTNKARNTAQDMIANFEETADCKGHWIKTSVAADGSFTVTNGRNGFSKTYTAR